MTITILHFSDLHYSTQDESQIELIKDQLIDNINKNKQISEKIDLIVFSGDLVQKPTEEAFNASVNKFIKPLMTELNVNMDNLSISCGNHDIDITKRDEVIFSGTKEQIIEKDNKKIITGIQNNEREILEVKPYTDFIKKLDQKTLKLINPFYSISIIEINHTTIGIVSFNSSFFMEGSKVDFGNLWIITDALLNAAKEIESCTIKIINIHHSFHWFKNSKDLEKILLDKFNIVFFGHEHEHDGKYILDVNNRDILSLHGSSIFHKKNSHNGYCVYTLDLDEEKIYIYKSLYNNQQKIFENIEPQILENINLTSKSSKAVRNLIICSEMYETVKEKINKYLAINLTSEKETKNIEDIFVFQQIVEENKEKNIENNKEQKEYLLEEIIHLNENILINGKSESGKSTNLNMINLYCLKDYTEYIPVYISSSELMHINSERQFIAKVAEYMDKNYANKKLKIDKMINENRFLFLLDDIHLLNKELIKKIVSLNNKIIATFTVDLQDEIETKLESLNKDEDIFKDFVKLKLKAFRKKDQQNLTTNIVANSQSSRIANSVHKTIVSLRLPSSPFITTLLIWMHIEKIDIKDNKPEIIDVFLDYLLEKTDLSKSFRGKFTFIDKKNLLADIAYEFYKKESFAVKENDILNCIITHVTKFGFDINAKDILDYFYERKIFLKNNGSLMFSYRVFYYYFISLHMINNREFAEQIMSSKVAILNMMDELRFYAAMKTDDKQFIDSLISLLDESTFNKRVQKYNLKSTNLSKTIEYGTKIIDEDNIIHQEKENIEFSDEEKKLSEHIDEKRTESHEKHVQKYNYEVIENQSQYNKQFYKEEYLVLNMILSEFLKYLSTVEIEDKKKYIAYAINNYSTLFKFWSETYEKTNLLKKFINFHKIDKDSKIEEKELLELIDFIRANTFPVISSIVEDTLSSPRMTKIYHENIIEENDLFNYYFYLIIEATIEEEKIIIMLDNLIDSCNNLNIFKSLYFTMIHNYLEKNYSSNTKKQLKELLVKLNIIIGKNKNVISTKKEYQKYAIEGLERVDEHLKIARMFI